ncbi:type I-F CRISPR-associated protein Csy3 [Solidesulfovibrio magneticus]|uniref:CRISPR-associated protein, Csy3 family n=1 Tax=Solidesulfovibrio magneticus (strain ATCC 700980 / DSM 13731 / RS-1) TaxID=573370 RepID=C4XPX1_SOLM1|nr:type I-F CRISPR-associated protein Csy3 [Solidesulfovibrio magneticus]BAH77671.1 hypothetical protein DMR_41800 [Solidesulfovibrio magneticus RS-1]
MATLKTASVLAFERKMDPSDGLFFAGNWNDRSQCNRWKPVEVREKSVRGTISNRLKAGEQDPAKLDAQIEKPNLQTVDVATLSPATDTLMVRFTLRVLGGVGVPSACNNADYHQKLQSTVAGYVKSNGLGILARRYACNLANGRFLWRNRIGAEAVEVVVCHLVNGETQSTWTFDSLALSLRSFASDTPVGDGLDTLAAVIESGLSGTGHVLLEVTAFTRMGAGQEVFPSQELILDRGRGDKSRTLYTVNAVAGMHSQKIGNAIRTIDDWHPEAEIIGPIAVEPYGSVTTMGKACRQPQQKQDFYNLLDAWVIKDKVPTLEDQHYVMAVLIRGGVFGEKDA